MQQQTMTKKQEAAHTYWAKAELVRKMAALAVNNLDYFEEAARQLVEDVPDLSPAMERIRADPVGEHRRLFIKGRYGPENKEIALHRDSPFRIIPYSRGWSVEEKKTGRIMGNKPTAKEAHALALQLEPARGRDDHTIDEVEVKTDNHEKKVEVKTMTEQEEIRKHVIKELKAVADEKLAAIDGVGGVAESMGRRRVNNLRSLHDHIKDGGGLTHKQVHYVYYNSGIDVGGWKVSEYRKAFGARKPRKKATTKRRTVRKAPKASSNGDGGDAGTVVDLAYTLKDLNEDTYALVIELAERLRAGE